MATSDIQCFTCSAEFSKIEELRDHIWYFQGEVAILLGKLQQLLAHRLPVDNEIPNVEPRLPPERQDAISSTVEPSSDQVEIALIQPLPKSTHYTDAAQHDSLLGCAYPACRKVYTRNQDLIRHSIEHLYINEFCHSCARTLPAHLYIKHACIKKGSNDQRAYIKKRARALRELAKQKVLSHQLPAALGTKELQTKEDTAIHTASEFLPPVRDQNNTVTNDPIATPIFLRDSLHSQPGPAQTSLNHRDVAHPREHSHSSRAYHLFSPLDNSGQDQLQYPIPLWSLDDTMQSFYSPNNSSLNTGGELNTMPENFGGR